MYGMVVQHILMKAGALDLTDTQKKELARVKEKYLYPLVQKEADFKISHLKTMDMLHGPDLDSRKAEIGDKGIESAQPRNGGYDGGCAHGYKKSRRAGKLYKDDEDDAHALRNDGERENDGRRGKDGE